MIDYINARCNQWVRWNRTRLDNGLGYPHECAYLKMPGSRSHGPPVDEAAWEIERAIRTLHADLHLAVVQFYLKRGTSEQKARACGCSAKHFYRRIHTAHIRIMEWLNDETAGVPHQVVKESACMDVTV